MLPVIQRPTARSITAPHRADPPLQVTDLRVAYPDGRTVVPAVRGLSFTVAEREVLAIVGESGAGKTAAGLAVMGLLPHGSQVAGSIRLAGQELIGLAPRSRRAVRGSRVAMVFQDPMTALNPVLTIGVQVAEAARAHQRISTSRAWARAVEALELVGIPEPRRTAAAYPHELSGGMRQRVLIAMAAINEPDVIIADEPTTALDVTVQAQVLLTLLEVTRAVDAAIVLITHNLAVVADIADRVLVMYAGQAVECGPTSVVFRSPRMPYTAGLLRSVPALTDPTDRLLPVLGAPPDPTALPPGCAFEPRCPSAVPSCRTTTPSLAVADRPDHFTACPRWPHWARKTLPLPHPGGAVPRVAQAALP